MIGAFSTTTLRGLAARLRRLGADQAGSVTIQVLVMSLLLLGTTGLVLDAGRAFSTHSQMQAFADQVALAAASELDRKPDSIDRARAAALGAGGVNPFLTEADGNGVAYEIDELSFYADLPTQTGVQSSNADLADFVITDEVADAATAQYVLASVRERTVPSLLSSMAGIAYAMTGQTNPFDGAIRLGATAVAGLEIKTCADMSTLVFCNPWEGRSEDPFADTTGANPNTIARIPGRSVQYFAPNFTRAGIAETPITDGRTIGSLYDWTVKNQLFRLTNPISDPGNACSPGVLLQLGIEDAEGTADYIAARDTCLMARARSERLCFGETVDIQPATGPMVTTALNTIFDTYLPPFDRLLDGVDPVMPGTGLTLAQFFEPDALGSGLFEPLPRDADGNVIPQRVEESATIPGAYFIALDVTFSDGVTKPYILNNEIPYEARPTPDARQLRFVANAGVANCHLGTMQQAAGIAGVTGCQLPFVSDENTLDSDGDGSFDDADGDGVPDFVFNGFADALLVSDYILNYYNITDPNLELPFGTWYDVYKWERERVLAGDLTGSTCLPLEDVVNDPFGMLPAQDCDAATPVKTAPTNYLDIGGANRTLLNTGYERRKIRSAMVNCEAATASPSVDGAFSTPIAAIVDVYLPRPPEYTCGVDASGVTIINCPVEDQVESRLYVEMVNKIDAALTERYTAQLVR